MHFHSAIQTWFHNYPLTSERLPSKAGFQTSVLVLALRCAHYQRFFAEADGFNPAKGAATWILMGRSGRQGRTKAVFTGHNRQPLQKEEKKKKTHLFAPQLKNFNKFVLFRNCSNLFNFHSSNLILLVVCK